MVRRSGGSVLHTKRQHGIRQAHLIGREAKFLLQCWTTQICINENRVFARLSHKNCQVGGNSTLPVIGKCTCHHQGMQRFVYT